MARSHVAPSADCELFDDEMTLVCLLISVYLLASYYNEGGSKSPAKISKASFSHSRPSPPQYLCVLFPPTVATTADDLSIYGTTPDASQLWHGGGIFVAFALIVAIQVSGLVLPLQPRCSEQDAFR